MTALATNLAAAQFAGRSDRLTDRAATLDKQISAASSLKSLMLQLSTSLGTAVRTGDLSAKPQGADAAVASATLTGAGRPSGTYALEVTALAAGQTLASPAYTSGASTLGSGTLTLRFGTVAQGGFMQDGAHPPVAVTIPAGATLSDVASAITNAGAGVSAYVAQTTTGARLVLKGADGAANGFVLDASETAGDPGLANLVWGPADDATRLLRGAADAAVKVDGLAVATTGNTVTGAIPSVSLKLTRANPGAPTQVSFADPSSAIGSAMEDFTAALNEVVSELGADTDAQTGALSRDSGARALRSSLSQLAGKVIMPNAATGAPRTLADLGLTLQRGGTFTLDTKRLSATLASDPQGAAAMFTNGLYGVYATVDSLARAAASTGTPGTLAASVNRYTAQKTQVTTDQAKLTTQQAALRTQLIARFSVADTSVGASKSTLTFLQNQIAAWNAKSS
jgi:flagellar hook-associated protein 2